MLVRQSLNAMSPEIERLRTQDIEPDENSAAYLALSQAAASAKGDKGGAGSDSEGMCLMCCYPECSLLFVYVSMSLSKCVCARFLRLLGEDIIYAQDVTSFPLYRLVHTTTCPNL